MAIADKTISELEAASLGILNANDVDFVAQVASFGVDYRVPKATMAALFAGSSTLTAYGGYANPDNAVGIKKDIYFQTNGKIYQKGTSAWTLVTQIGGVIPAVITITAGVTASPLIVPYSGNQYTTQYQLIRADGSSDWNTTVLYDGANFTVKLDTDSSGVKANDSGKFQIIPNG